MPGGIHPPLEEILSWPAPNYINPPLKPPYVLIVACVFGPINLVTFLSRIWVRLRIQRNSGWDDFLMLAAGPPVMALTVIYPLVIQCQYFNRHIWDVPVTAGPKQRQFVMVIYITFAIASGFIKASILLFYRRLSPRSVSATFRWILRLSIGFIAVSTFIFVILTIFTCDPISAFWNQTNFFLIASGKYKYQCLDEGAEIVANGALSAFQDLIAATLPAALCWNLPLSGQQKFALYCIFAISYLAVALGALRTFSSYKLFFETYDITWVAGDIWLWSMLELHIGCMCANAPAVKVFYRYYFRAPGSSTAANSRSQQSWPKVPTWSSVTSRKQSGYLSGSHTSSHGMVVKEEARSDIEAGDVEMGDFIPNQT